MDEPLLHLGESPESLGEPLPKYSDKGRMLVRIYQDGPIDAEGNITRFAAECYD